MSEEKLPPIHPGEILLEEFLKPMGISQYRLAKDINVPARRINEIVLGKRAISPDTALRLSPLNNTKTAVSVSFETAVLLSSCDPDDRRLTGQSGKKQ